MTPDGEEIWPPSRSWLTGFSFFGLAILWPYFCLFNVTSYYTWLNSTSSAIFVWWRRPSPSSHFPISHFSTLFSSFFFCSLFLSTSEISSFSHYISTFLRLDSFVVFVYLDCMCVSAASAWHGQNINFYSMILIWFDFVFLNPRLCWPTLLSVTTLDSNRGHIHYSIATFSSSFFYKGNIFKRKTFAFQWQTDAHFSVLFDLNYRYCYLAIRTYLLARAVRANI